MTALRIMSSLAELELDIGTSPAEPRALQLVRFWKRHYGLTIDQLAMMANCDRRTVERWLYENGHLGAAFTHLLRTLQLQYSLALSRCPDSPHLNDHGWYSPAEALYGLDWHVSLWMPRNTNAYALVVERKFELYHHEFDVRGDESLLTFLRISKDHCLDLIESFKQKI